MSNHIYQRTFLPKNRKTKISFSRIPILKADKRLDIDISRPEEKEDRGTIYVPIDAETVIYTDTDGQSYEVSIDELIDADVDNEITYTNTDFDDDNDDDEQSAKTATNRSYLTKKRHLQKTYNNIIAKNQTFYKKHYVQAR
ncbi:MAG: hypothetical protein IJ500_01875 [Alphaproteobacteria bacterium]|nr:hypothetical protein [Alphaproteobacteria bacterium]